MEDFWVICTNRQEFLIYHPTHTLSFILLKLWKNPSTFKDASFVDLTFLLSLTGCQQKEERECRDWRSLLSPKLVQQSSGRASRELNVELPFPITSVAKVSRWCRVKAGKGDFGGLLVQSEPLNWRPGEEGLPTRCSVREPESFDKEGFFVLRLSCHPCFIEW